MLLTIALLASGMGAYRRTAQLLESAAA